MPMTWNDKTHTKLLVAILHTTNAKLDLEAIANYMGPECTTVALRLHIQQLKRQVADASDSTPTTPTSQSKNQTKRKGIRYESPKKRKMERVHERELKLEESLSMKVEDAKNEDVGEEQSNFIKKEEALD